MQNLIRRDATWYARFFIPTDRWADVGKAMRAANGVKREVVRTLGTTDRREAKRRLQPALTAIQGQVDAALKGAGLVPLTDWTADWAARAIEVRAVIEAADNVRVVVPASDGDEVGETERDLTRGSFRPEAEALEAVKGPAVAAAFWKAATTDEVTIQEGIDRWLAEVGSSIRVKTSAGHRAVFKSLEAFLQERYGHLSLTSMSFSDITRRMAGEFIAWRSAQVSVAAVKREFSAPMGLWRWAVRRGHTEDNPWTDQTAGLSTKKQCSGDGDSDEDDKRAFKDSEVVTLVNATGPDWSPNGGGYGATLWDASRLALLTGLRAAELADLRVKDLIENRTVVSVPKGKTKNARRLVPLPKAAQRVIEARLAELPDTSPDAPLWPELPVTSLTESRGGKLSDKFRAARPRLLPNAENVDFHSLRRSYATMLEAAMHSGGRVNPAIIASLMGHSRGTMALDLYSSGPAMKALVDAVADMEALGIGEDVLKALTDTAGQRPRMKRFQPVGAAAGRAVGDPEPVVTSKKALKGTRVASKAA